MASVAVLNRSNPVLDGAIEVAVSGDAGIVADGRCLL